MGRAIRVRMGEKRTTKVYGALDAAADAGDAPERDAPPVDARPSCNASACPPCAMVGASPCCSSAGACGCAMFLVCR